jgi:hypothetical protein
MKLGMEEKTREKLRKSEIKKINLFFFIIFIIFISKINH